MKNLSKILGLLFVSVCLFSCTINKPVEKKKTITVSASASVQIPSDVEILRFTVITSGWSARQIVQDNDVITERFVNAVKAVGVSEDDISRTQCVVTNPNGYEARRSVVVTVRNLSLAPQVIDCKTGSIRLSSTNFEVIDTQSEIRNVRTKAVQNAFDAGSLLAGASGSKIGTVQEIVSDEISTRKTEDNHLELTSKIVITYDLE